METHDVIVIGGGASGLMCGGLTARGGLDTLIVEGRERPARKLLITGKGRCNVTNACTPQEFIASVRTNPRFLYSAASAFPPALVMAFFEEQGVPLKIERGGRVFPQSDKAVDIVDALVRFVRRSGAAVLTARAAHLLLEDGRVRGVRTADGAEYAAKSVVLCTGGMSYPATGSDGAGYALAREAGHTIVPPRPSLVPILCEDPDGRFPRLEGLSLKNVTLSLFEKTGRRVWSELGEMLFTQKGVSGPLVLTASGMMTKPAGAYRMEIDLKPGLTPEQLDARLLRDFSDAKNRELVNALGALLPSSIIPEVVAVSGVPADTRINQLSREQRAALGGAVKAFPLSPAALAPIEEAVVTSGGVDVREIDPKTMQSRRAPGLYFAGEVMDVDARTGGFNLQIAWCTAHAAASAILAAQD